MSAAAAAAPWPAQAHNGAPLAGHRVAILQRIVPHYRVAVFNRLRDRLAADGIALDIVAGQPRADEAFDDCRAEVGGLTTTRNLHLPGGLYLQPVWSRLTRADLVVMEHASKPLLNHLLLLRRCLTGRPPRIFFFGHGDDFQGLHRAGLSRRLKTRTAHLADGWLAYTEASRQHLLGFGIPAARITVVNNTIDTTDVVTRSALAGDDGLAIRRTVGLGPGPVAVFCGRLYEGKQVPFMLASWRRARERSPDLQLLVIGDGPLLPWLHRETEGDRSIAIAGARFGQEKWALLAAADTMLMPACIGLSIVDAFAVGLPVIAARFDGHGPEAGYLEDGRNSIMTATSPQAYAEAIVAACSEPGIQQRLAEGAARTGRELGLEAMVHRFAQALTASLAASAHA